MWPSSWLMPYSCLFFPQLWRREWPFFLLQPLGRAGIPRFWPRPASQPGGPQPAAGVLPVPLWQRLRTVAQVLVSKLIYRWGTVSRFDRSQVGSVSLFKSFLVCSSCFSHGEELIVTPFAQVDNAISIFLWMIYRRCGFTVTLFCPSVVSQGHYSFIVNMYSLKQDFW